MRFLTWSYRYGEQILNSKLAFRKEIEEAISAVELPPAGMSRPQLNAEIAKQLMAKD
jgi:hypothetical protein